MPHAARLILSYFVAVIAAAMVAAIFILFLERTRPTRQNALMYLALVHALLGTAALCASEHYYDRYALDATWSLVLLIPMAVRWNLPAIRIASAAALIAIAAFSTFATGEYFAWNRARWNAWLYF